MTALPAPSGPPAGASAGRLSAAAGRVAPALAEASRRTGVPFDALFQTARLESGFDPDARARTSSATGLFQFIDSTWLKTLARHGPRHGLAPATRADALGLRRDPFAASLMAAHHMADNAAVLAARTGRAPGQVELYLAHFLGAGGAADFLDGLASTPDRSAAELMPAAARANRSIFFAGGRAQSLAEVYERFARKLGGGPTPEVPSQPTLPTVDAIGTGSAQAGSAGDALPNALHTARLAYLLLADLGA